MQIEDLAKMTSDTSKNVNDLTGTVTGLSATVSDLTKVVGNLSKVVTDGFKEMRVGFKELREDTDLILQTVNEHSSRLDRIEGDLGEVKKTVVNLPTKEYVDDKISALRGEVVTIARDAARNAVGTK